MSDASMPRYNPQTPNVGGYAAPVAPKQIQWAYLLLLAAAALQLIAAIFSYMHINSAAFRTQLEDQIATQDLQTTGTDLSTADIVSAGIGFALVTAIVMAVVAIVVYVLLAVFIRKGHGWARIVALILAVLSLTTLIGLVMPGGVFSILQVLAGIVAVVFCFIAPGSTFFAEMKAYRAANKQR